jgi:hypothetical protein
LTTVGAAEALFSPVALGNKVPGNDISKEVEMLYCQWITVVN